MIIILSYEKSDVASATRLSKKYNTVVVKAQFLKVRNYNISNVTPAAGRAELGNLTRITIMGHSNSTTKFGEHNVTDFTNFVCRILETNNALLTNLRAIDLLGCDVGRVYETSSMEAVATAAEVFEGIEVRQYTSFVKEFVGQLALRVSHHLEHDLSIRAFSTPPGQLYRKTLLYENLNENLAEPSTWLYLGLDESQYEHFKSLESDEGLCQIFLDKNTRLKAKVEAELDKLQSSAEEEQREYSESELAKKIELEAQLLKLNDKIQHCKSVLIEKHLAIKAYLLQVPTKIIPETDDPIATLERESFCGFVIPTTRAEAKQEAMLSAAIEINEAEVAAQLSLKARLATEKILGNKTNTSVSGNVHQVPGDGNCFFSAVAYELERQGLDSYTHQALRAEAVEYLRAHLEIFTEAPLEDDEEMEAYLARMGNDREYADRPIIIALAQRFNIQLTIMRTEAHGAQHMEDINQVEGIRGRVGLLHHGEYFGAHYDALELDNTVVHSTANSNSIR